MDEDGGTFVVVRPKRYLGLCMVQRGQGHLLPIGDGYGVEAGANHVREAVAPFEMWELVHCRIVGSIAPNVQAPKLIAPPMPRRTAGAGLPGTMLRSTLR